MLVLYIWYLCVEFPTVFDAFRSLKLNLYEDRAKFVKNEINRTFFPFSVNFVGVVVLKIISANCSLLLSQF